MFNTATFFPFYTHIVLKKCCDFSAENDFAAVYRMVSMFTIVGTSPRIFIMSA